MYGVKYKVPFKTLSDIDSVVTLEERGYTGSVIELIAGGTPFTINTDQSDLLTPIRSSTATLSVVGSDYLQDLYANDPQGIRVKCEVGGEVKWLGYLLPDTFSQDFTHPEFEYEMECVSAFSTLKNRDFDLKSGFVSFLEIIKKARDYAGYNDLYLTNETLASDVPWYNLKISSANFYDELGEAMTYYEVLEEIAKYLGLTIVPYEDDLYFLDYFAIKKEFIAYSRIVGDTISSYLYRDAKRVEEYKGTGAKLSRIPGKNKAVVNCSLYETDKNIIEFNDEGSRLSYMLPKADVDIKRGKEDGKRHFLLRMFDNDRYTFYKYSPQPNGTLIMKEESGRALNETEIGTGFSRTATYDTFPDTPPPSKLDFTSEVIVRAFSGVGSVQGFNMMGKSDPVISGKSGYIISAPGAYFAISFKYKLMLDQWYIKEPELDGNVTGKTNVELKLGDYYFNGTSWTKTKSTFEVDIETGDKFLGTYHSVKDTNSYEKGMPDVSGFLVPTPPFVVSGNVSMTIFYHGHRRVASTQTMIKYTYYKDISVMYAVPDEQAIYGDWVSKDSKNDLIYENEIDDDYIEPADEIDLKICTRPDGKVGLACVLDGSDFLKKITSKVFGTDIAENILLKKVIELYKKPRFVIDPVLENNAKPYTVFTELHLGKEFMYAGGEEDVRMESARYNLIEI